jgi:hypothetical protein
MNLDRKIPIWTLLVLALLVTTPVRPAIGFNEPDGWGKAKLGMSEDAFTKAYPRAPLVTPPPPPQTEPLLAPFSTYQLEHQQVGPLKGCGIQFRFYLHELYDLQFHCADKEAAMRYLQTELGTPTKTMGNALMWTGKERGASQVPKTGAFSFHDLQRGHAAQAAMLRLMGQAQKPPQPPTPADMPKAE